MTIVKPDSWTPFMLVALALCAGSMGATMASPLYPLYEESWRLPASTISFIYVSYMLGVLAAFLFLGRLSDHAGPFKILRAALLLILVGLVASAMAEGVACLIAGRVAIGLASGLITTAATIGLLDSEPHGPLRRASLVASITTMAGFGLGPFVAGLIAQFAPAPLVTPYLAVIAPIALVFVGLTTIRTPVHQKPTARLSLHPRLTLPASGARPIFLLASLAVFTAYALFSLLASLAPSFIEDVLPWHGAAASGTAIAMVLFCSAAVQFPARRMAPALSLRLALGAMIVGVVLLGLSLHYEQGLLFALADLAVGAGHGLAFMAGLALVNGIAQERDRSGILSSFFSIGYLGTVAPILAVGFLADHIGLAPAVIVFCTVFALTTSLLLLASWIVNFRGDPGDLRSSPDTEMRHHSAADGGRR